MEESKFINGNKTYVYDFEFLTIEQVELAREVGEFKHNTLENPPDSFIKVIKSGSADWLPKLTSYLLVEEVEGKKIPFDRDNAERNTEPFIKSLPAKEVIKLRECVEDFFLNIGRSQLGSVILSGEKSFNSQQMLSMLVQMNLNKNLNNESFLNEG